MINLEKKKIDVVCVEIPMMSGAQAIGCEVTFYSDGKEITKFVAPGYPDLTSYHKLVSHLGGKYTFYKFLFTGIDAASQQALHNQLLEKLIHD